MTETNATATAVRYIGGRANAALTSIAAARDAVDTGRYADARSSLTAAARALATGSRKYSLLPTYSAAANAHMDRIAAARTARVEVLNQIRAIDEAYRVATGYDHGAPDHWTAPQLEPAATPEPEVVLTVIVVRAAYTDTPDKVLVPRDGESFEDTIRRHYPRAENIGHDSFDHPDTVNGYYADRIGAIR